MTYVRLTWQPANTTTPETMTADIPPARITELRELITDPNVDLGETVLWIPVRLDHEPPDAPFTKLLFRLARITAIDTPGDAG